jgi:cell division protein FtsN
MKCSGRRSGIFNTLGVTRFSTRRARARLVSLCLIFVVVPHAFPDDLVAHALEREKAGEHEEAAKLLSTWLEANAGAAGSAAVFESYFRVEQDLHALLDAGGRFLESGKGTAGAAEEFLKIARLYELAGRVESARDAYLAAYAEGASESTLVSAFFLSMQMNDSDAMKASLEKFSGKGRTPVLLLQALSDLRSGDRTAARATLTALGDQTGDADVALKALWVLFQSAKVTGDSQGQQAARSKLASRFSAAPETALAAGPASPAPAASPRTARPLVVQLASPPVFDIEPTPPKADLSAPPKADLSASALPSSPRVSVQAGSFVMKENADDLLSELLRRGFAGVVVHELSQGKDHYRVLAGTGLQMDAARETLKRLSDAGFRGFLLQEKESTGGPADAEGPSSQR